jgi:hypothetical protein
MTAATSSLSGVGRLIKDPRVLLGLVPATLAALNGADVPLMDLPPSPAPLNFAAKLAAIVMSVAVLCVTCIYATYPRILKIAVLSGILSGVSWRIYGSFIVWAHTSNLTIDTLLDTAQIVLFALPFAFATVCFTAVGYVIQGSSQRERQQAVRLTNKDTAKEPTSYSSCFISYSSQDHAFAELLHGDLRKSGVQCWFAPEDMKIGDPIRQRIDEAIHQHDKLLVVLSENSVGSSWVANEVEATFEKERHLGKIFLLPLRVDDEVMNTDLAWAADIRRTRNIGDFRNWQDPTSYKRSLDRLLRDLKADERSMVAVP